MTVILYGTTIFLSAFLLFQVQPLIAKMILPWFGGSAAVWSAAILFFQLVLLAGYTYAHCSIRYLSRKMQLAVHVILLAAGCALLPILPASGWKPSGAEDPTLRILLLLGATIGLPYFLLSATSPLLQAWYVRRSVGAMPYRLFALSNFGSMLALLSFPVLVEPQLASRQQAYLWSGAFVLFAVLCGAAAWVSRGDRVPARQVETGETAPVGRPPVTQLLVWVALAACASTLLVAVTNHLSQNVAPIPLLWVVPLALYLATFILAFESDRAYQRWIFLLVLWPILGLMVYLMYLRFGNAPIKWIIPVFAVGLFICCMVCHGELARRKPAARYLTLFYLMVSLGGALGGVFVTLIAPRVFHSYLELPVGLVTCAVLAGSVLWYGKIPKLGAWPVRGALVLGVIVLAVYIVRQEQLIDRGQRVTARNFYGVLRVRDNTGRTQRDSSRLLFHGTILHGSQLLDADLRYRATSYYGPNSGAGRALRALEERGPIRVGLIGLGAGVLSTYGRAGDVYRIYEINPLVERIARTEFSYYAHSPADKRVLLGDARLVLERQDSQQFDLLAVDAFSSDAVPVHLLTREALALYVRHLKPSGILALHVTNRFLDLVPVCVRGAQELGLPAIVVRDEGDMANYLSPSVWVLMTADPSWWSSPSFKTADLTRAVPPRDFRPWTDDYSNIFQILKLDEKVVAASIIPSTQWDIIPGRSIGPVQVGMDVREVVQLLGPPTSTNPIPGGGNAYLWFAAPRNAGLGVSTTVTGKVSRVWGQNHTRYVTEGRLRAGSTEADIVAALGTPSTAKDYAQPPLRILGYDSRGIWFGIQLDRKLRFHNEIFEIGVFAPHPLPAPRGLRKSLDRSSSIQSFVR